MILYSNNNDKIIILRCWFEIKNIYCVVGKAGTLLLDTIGVHTGVSKTTDSRYISRIHFVEKFFKKYIKPSIIDKIKSKIKKLSFK